MFIHYGLNGESHSPTIQPEKFVDQYDQYVGEEVYFWPGVVEVGDDTLIVEYYTVTYTIQTSRDDIKQGDLIQVYGTLRPGHVIEPHSIVPSQNSGRQKMYALSLLGSGLVILVFLRCWKFDQKRLAFTTRGDSDA
jgi:hypothetical protein